MNVTRVLLVLTLILPALDVFSDGAEAQIFGFRPTRTPAVVGTPGPTNTPGGAVPTRTPRRRRRDGAATPIPTATPTLAANQTPLPTSTPAPATPTATPRAPRCRDTTTRPKVVGAISTSNTSVVVQFSKAMGDSAVNPAAYAIVQQNVNPEVGSLRVTGARFADPGRLSVELLTRSQNEVTYKVTANHVLDVCDLPLADKEPFGVDPTSATFPGTPSPTAGLDTDEDGISDDEEQFGYQISIHLAEGTGIDRQVTSDPDSADTDEDGLDDATEKAIQTDPRDGDTDDDQLTDYVEFNEIYSDPTRQDSDGDTLYDGIEVSFFRTSAIQSDTDGDQIRDDEEISLANRNPKVGDLPKPALEVGEMSMALDVRFVEVEGTERREVESRTETSTLEQSERKEFSSSESRTIEVGLKQSQTIGTNIGFGTEGGGAGYSENINISATTEQTFNSSFTSSWTETSSQETTDTYEDSLTSTVEDAENRNITREVFGARMQVAVSLKTPGDIAFTLKNVQVTALIQDPIDPLRLTPVATLLPDSEPAEGYSLGPLVPQRGPILFSNSEVFPQLVEDLMRNPRGLVFRFSNYDITDELGRNFAFTSQEINDRTAALAIDYGGFDSDQDGVGDYSEIKRVATSIGRRAIDTDGDGDVDEDDRPVVFDGNGRQVGITLRDALQAIGLTEYDEAETPSSTLSSADLQNSYSIADEAGVKKIFRIRRTAAVVGEPRRWEVVLSTGINRRLALDEYLLQPGSNLTLAFVKDEDRDGMTALIEYINNCSDGAVDTDGDTLDDRFEALVGWEVTTERGTKKVRSRCSIADTDRDGRTDDDEAPGVLTRDDDGLILFDDGVSLVDPNDLPHRDTSIDVESYRVRPEDTAYFLSTFGDPITDPSRKDTDQDGIDDGIELDGFTVTLLTPPPPTVFRMTSPEFFDSDGDTASDGIEKIVGGDPREDDFQNFGDNDGDGLVNIQETSGWQIEIRGVSTTPSLCDVQCNEGPLTTRSVHSDPDDPDTDGDGLTDAQELDLLTDPDDPDTDDDGLRDATEALGFNLRNLGILVTKPADADTDNDKRNDGLEADLGAKIIVRVPGSAPYQAFSHPLDPDNDFDRLSDGDEANAGTDPANFDTDGHGRSDYEEVKIGSRPLVPDYRVQVTFTGIYVKDDCEDGDGAGEWTFDLGLRLPNDQLVSVVNSFDATGFYTTLEGLPTCDGDEDERPCRPNNDDDTIRIERETTLLFPLYGSGARVVHLGGVSTTDALAEEFSVEGYIFEDDGASIPDGGPFLFPDPTAEGGGDGDSSSGTGIIPGSELELGSHAINMRRKGVSLIAEEACDLTLLVFYNAQ